MGNRKSVIIYDSWGTMIEALPAEQAGKLIKAICAYSFSGIEPEIDDPAINAVFLMIRSKLDEDAEAYKEEVKRRSEAGKKGMSKRWGKEPITNNNTVITNNNSVKHGITNITDSVSVSVSVSDKDINNTPKPPTETEAVSSSDLSEPLKAKIMEWLAYKRERREAYKPTGLKSLLTEVKRHETESGTDAVVNLVGECMANGWRGIIWERLTRPPVTRSGTNPKIHSMPERAYDFQALERQLIKNG